MFKTIVKFVTILVLIMYAFDKGYDEGYKNRDNKFPDDYY